MLLDLHVFLNKTFHLLSDHTCSVGSVLSSLQFVFYGAPVISATALALVHSLHATADKNTMSKSINLYASLSFDRIAQRAFPTMANLLLPITTGKGFYI